MSAALAINLEIIQEAPTTPLMVSRVAVMPTKAEVLAYARPITKLFISKYAHDLPEEQKIEIEQTANLRVLEAYESLNPASGWKSFVYNHCRGAVLDYLKFGKGFQEDKWSLVKEEAAGSRNSAKLRERVFNSVGPEDDDAQDLEHVLGANGIFSFMESDRIAFDWNLIAQMAHEDVAIHALGKWLRGFSMEEIGEVLGISRARAGQIIAECIDRLKPTANFTDRWTRLTVYAFGLAEMLGLSTTDMERDTTVSSFPKVDLDAQAAPDFERPQHATGEQLGFDGFW